MDENVKKCDVCNERQLSANNWIKYRDPPDGHFWVRGKRDKKSASQALYKDACGHTCAIKAFNNWLVAVHVNVATEVKKDETP
ncbi:MAG TPA: hypothetical protein VI728_13235 [Syntrophales bacterium]|nr:hypothetical protein [Syntrophales bacterium]